MDSERILDLMTKAGLDVRVAAESWGGATSLLAALDAVGRDGGSALVKIDGQRCDGQVYTVLISGGRLGEDSFRRDGADLAALLRDALTFYVNHACGGSREVSILVPSRQVDEVFVSLHDAMLIRVCVEWGSGVCVLVARRSPEKGGEVAIEVTGMRRLECPHHLPWGPSLSINTARCTTNGTEVLLEVELQSGDVILIEGAAIRLE